MGQTSNTEGFSTTSTSTLLLQRPLCQVPVHTIAGSLSSRCRSCSWDTCPGYPARVMSTVIWPGWPWTHGSIHEGHAHRTICREWKGHAWGLTLKTYIAHDILSPLDAWGRKICFEETKNTPTPTPLDLQNKNTQEPECRCRCKQGLVSLFSPTNWNPNSFQLSKQLSTIQTAFNDPTRENRAIN